MVILSIDKVQSMDNSLTDNQTGSFTRRMNSMNLNTGGQGQYTELQNQTDSSSWLLAE